MPHNREDFVNQNVPFLRDPDGQSGVFNRLLEEARIHNMPERFIGQYIAQLLTRRDIALHPECYEGVSGAKDDLWIPPSYLAKMALFQQMQPPTMATAEVTEEDDRLRRERNAEQLIASLPGLDPDDEDE